jgi:hypothetical protein
LGWTRPAAPEAQLPVAVVLAHLAGTVVEHAPAPCRGAGRGP